MILETFAIKDKTQCFDLALQYFMRKESDEPDLQIFRFLLENGANIKVLGVELLRNQHILDYLDNIHRFRPDIDLTCISEGIMGRVVFHGILHGKRKPGAKDVFKSILKLLSSQRSRRRRFSNNIELPRFLVDNKIPISAGFGKDIENYWEGGWFLEEIRKLALSAPK